MKKIEWKVTEQNLSQELVSSDDRWCISKTREGSAKPRFFLSNLELILTPHGTGSDYHDCFEKFIADCDTYINKVKAARDEAVSHFDRTGRGGGIIGEPGKMKVALVDVDGHGFPNLALMKLSAWHKSNGDSVEWYSPLFSRPDRLYASKVFTFTPEYRDFAPCAPPSVCGGTGYDATVKLPAEVERTLPDYSIYPEFTPALGFLSRGCIRFCPWCVVPRKEGKIRVVDDVERISAGRREVVLLDNNFLATPPDFVSEQLAKAKTLKLKIDFNQALDARLVNEQNARELAETKWIHYIRFSCDTGTMLEPMAHAVELVRGYGYRGEFFVYVLAKEVEEAYDRICRLTAIDKKIVPFCQPFRDFTLGGEPPVELRRLARWCNIQSIRKTVSFRDYRSGVHR